MIGAIFTCIFNLKSKSLSMNFIIFGVIFCFSDVLLIFVFLICFSNSSFLEFLFCVYLLLLCLFFYVGFLFCYGFFIVSFLCLHHFMFLSYYISAFTFYVQYCISFIADFFQGVFKQYLVILIILNYFISKISVSSP